MQRVLFAASLFAIAATTAGCDPSATSATEGTSVAPRRVATAGESCAATRDCGADLRCVDQTCQPARASVLGEVFAAQGRLAVKESRYEMALTAYAESVKAYEADKAPPPAMLYCEQGAALIAAGGDPQRQELAARVLHRCVLGSPAGSEVRRQAMDSLAMLIKYGLDPKLIARDKLADRYLTAKATVPNAEKLKVEISSAKPVNHRTYTKFIERLQAEDVQEALTPCWKAHWEASRKPEMKVSLPFKHSYLLDEYDDFSRTTLVITDLEPTGDPAIDGARECVKEVLSPIADAHTKGRYDERRWTADITVTAAPEK